MLEMKKSSPRVFVTIGEEWRSSESIGSEKWIVVEAGDDQVLGNVNSHTKTERGYHRQRRHRKFGSNVLQCLLVRDQPERV